MNQLSGLCLKAVTGQKCSGLLQKFVPIFSMHLLSAWKILVSIFARVAISLIHIFFCPHQELEVDSRTQRASVP